MNYSCLPFFVFKTENNELIPIRLNDEGIMLPDCHSQWYHSKSNELVFRRQNYIILPILLLGLWWRQTLSLSKEQSLLMTTVLLKTSLTRLYCKNLNFQQKLIRPIFSVIMVYYISFPYILQINSELFRTCSSHTLLISSGRFPFLYVVLLGSSGLCGWKQ